MPSSVLRRLVAETQSPGERPHLPQVADTVHYHCPAWGQGPYAAIVNAVTLVSGSETSTEARVDLTVFTSDPYRATRVALDVPAVALGEAHSHDSWWVWP